MRTEPAEIEFVNSLKRHRGIWQLGLGLGNLMRLLTVSLYLLLTYGFLDFSFGFSELTRYLIGIGLSFGLLVYGFILVKRSLRLGLHEIARTMDTGVGNKRFDILSAWELRQDDSMDNENGEDELSGYLRKAKIRDALEKLKAVSFKDSIDGDFLWRHCKLLGVSGVVFCLVVLQFPTVSEIVLKRIFEPASDMPPFSLYAFSVVPEEPAVLYGEDLDIEVSITGAPIHSEVYLLVRNSEGIKRMRAYKQDDIRFSQRLNNVVEPFEFAFVTGKARSTWRSVELLLEPQMTELMVKVKEPEYTGLAPRNFQLGEQALITYRNADVILDVSSNRPLASGNIRIISDNETIEEKVVRGEVTGLHTVRFQWESQYAAQVEVRVFDVRGTYNREAYVFKQKLREDAKPIVGFEEPRAFVMATPESSIDLIGTASDDLAIKRVDLYRGLVGFRDRVSTLADSTVGKEFSFKQTLDLKKLGLEAGQTLEFYLEARDSNPSYLGMNASEPVRVKIISMEDYETLMRSRVTSKEFYDRFRVARKQVEALQDAAKELLDGLKKSGTRDEEKERLLRDFVKKHKEVTDMLQAMADDFPVYEMEKSFNEALDAIAMESGYRHRELKQYDIHDPKLIPFVEGLLQETEKNRKQIQEFEKDTDKLQKIAEVMELGYRYNALIRKQESLVKQLEVFDSKSSTNDERWLQYLADLQKGVQSELKQLMVEMDEQSMKLADEEMNESTLQLFDSMQKFLDALREARITDEMELAISHARENRGREAYRYAAVALEKMKNINNNNSENTFVQIAAGGNPLGDFGLGEGLGNTLEQLLGQLRQMYGQGKGDRPGQGGSGGDGPESGFVQHGGSLLNIPTYGPKRNRYDFQDRSNSGEGRTAKGLGSPERLVEGVGGSGEAKTDGAEKQAEVGVVQIPPKYRESFKKYFNPKL